MTKRRRVAKIRVEDNIPSFPNTEESLPLEQQSLISTNAQENHPGANETHHNANEIVDADMGEPETSEKVRGPTILADVWNQSPDEKVAVKFNSQGHPIGEEASLLASFLGTIGRNPELAPQGYADWRVVPIEYKLRCMNEIKLRFSFSEKRDKCILASLGRKVKDFRGELKAEYYEVNKHDRNKLVNQKPPRVPKAQWLKLISYWDQEKIKRRATMNKNNRKDLTMPHCAGRKSFARLRAEKTVDGVEPSRAQIFIETHKDRITRDKKKIDEESARAKELMQNKLNELPGATEQSNGKIAWKGDIFDQVLNKEERHGRVRGVGLGVRPTSLWGQSSAEESSNTESMTIPSELVQKLVYDKLVEMQQTHAQEMKIMQEKQDNITKEFKEYLERQSRLEKHMGTLVRVLTARASERGYSITTNNSPNRSGGR